MVVVAILIVVVVVVVVSQYLLHGIKLCRKRLAAQCVGGPDFATLLPRRSEERGGVEWEREGN